MVALHFSPSVMEILKPISPEVRVSVETSVDFFKIIINILILGMLFESRLSYCFGYVFNLCVVYSVKLNHPESFCSWVALTYQSAKSP